MLNVCMKHFKYGKPGGPGVFPKLNSLTRMVKHWFKTCSLPGIVHRVCVWKLEGQGGQCMQVKCKYTGHAWSLPHFYKRSSEYSLNSYGLSTPETIHEIIVRGPGYGGGEDTKGQAFTFADMTEKLQETAGISSGPCWTATNEMPIAPHCICIKWLLFQVCVYAQFKFILELLDHLAEGSFKVNWFP